MLNWIAAGALAGGMKGRVIGVLGGAVIMTMGLGPLYLWEPTTGRGSATACPR